MVNKLTNSNQLTSSRCEFCGLKTKTMKIYQAVQTQEQAKQIIIDSFESDNKFKDGIWSNSSCQCECGQTSLLKYNANSIDGDSMIQYAVGICSSCGTDAPSISAAVNINIW